MKKKFFGGIAVLALATVIGINVKMNSQENQLSDLALANVEALAQNEGSVSNCPGGSCTMTDSKWDRGCSACCPEGKSPRCDWSGCSCM